MLNRNQGLAIVGGSGAGKTSLAHCLALRTGLDAIDLDDFISKKCGKTIPEIFDGGEEQFRALEAECLPECMERPAVLALGAGAWEHPAIRQMLPKAGWKALWLAEKPSKAWERVKYDPARPLAGNRAEFMARWRSRMNEWSVLPCLLPLGRSPDELARLLAP